MKIYKRGLKSNDTTKRMEKTSTNHSKIDSQMLENNPLSMKKDSQSLELKSHRVKEDSPSNTDNYKLKTQNCRNFEQQRFCSYKQKCKFLHPNCEHWQKGFCRRGSNCMYEHLPNQRDTTKTDKGNASPINNKNDNHVTSKKSLTDLEQKLNDQDSFLVKGLEDMKILLLNTVKNSVSPQIQPIAPFQYQKSVPQYKVPTIWNR